MNISWSKSNWKGISFWKYFKMKFLRRKSLQRPAANFLHWRVVKIARIAEFTTSKLFTFNDFFHFPGLNWSLKGVKHTIFSLQKQLIFNKYFLIYTHFAGGGKGLKNAYFYPGTEQIVLMSIALLPLLFTQTATKYSLYNLINRAVA